MSRTVATVWHASLSTLAAILYFLFVLPRWWELTGYSPHVLGTVMRVILGLLVGATALPVAAVLKQARKPEYGTPQLALSLLTGSIIAHLVAGALIVGTAVSEIWLSLDSFGMWLFGIYGAAAAIALLGIGAFYLAFVAEMPPPPPKPIKPKADKQPKQRRRWGKKSGDAKAEDSEGSEADDESEETVDADDADDDVDADATEADDADAETETAEIDESAGEEAGEPASTADDKLRPSGKRRAKKGQ
ncbi:hypothetical protein K3U94_21965 [Mycolicibacter heraklionensis]|uniref:Transmembrane protein n=1 Tax=Mycolicibacter heraklionensis TaxID=512402 RepID=A0A9X7WH74_9MYCO|nr:hypothetical protein [Mycolicibacter heraklionensis]QZA07557.1 hypothetical protein K3U94_21965 [Mycolicibacter heraklionensis]